MIFAFKVDKFLHTNFDGVLGMPNKFKTQSLVDTFKEK